MSAITICPPGRAATTAPVEIQVQSADFGGFLKQLAEKFVRDALQRHAEEMQELRDRASQEAESARQARESLKEMSQLRDQNKSLREEIQRLSRLSEDHLEREQRLHDLIDAITTSFSSSNNLTSLTPQDVRSRAAVLSSSSETRRVLKGELDRMSGYAKQLEFSPSDARTCAPSTPSVQQPMSPMSPPTETVRSATQQDRGTTSSPLSPSLRDRTIDAVFKILDKNGDGLVSEQEWAEALGTPRNGNRSPRQQVVTPVTSSFMPAAFQPAAVQMRAVSPVPVPARMMFPATAMVPTVGLS